MGKIRDFFLPCAERLDAAFKANMLAAAAVKKSIHRSPHTILDALKSISHHDFEGAARRIRKATDTERRKHERPKNKPVPHPHVYGDIWNVFSR